MGEASDDGLVDPERGSDVDADSGVDRVVEGDLEGDAVPGDDPDSEVVDDIDELVAVTQERDQFKDIALRLQADFENYKKRTAANTVDAVDQATGRLATALLPVLDAAEAAYLQHPDEIGPLLNAMLTELKKHGLETLDLEGQPFDPEVAEAVTHDPLDGGEVMVSEVMRSGYRWKGRTLRPAMVRTRD